MYFRDVHYLGSFIDNLSEPDESFTNRGYYVETWNFKTDTSDNFSFKMKTKMTYDDMLDEWFVVFSKLFPDFVIKDARRIAFDLNVVGKYPSNVVLGSIIVACQYHDYNFKQHFKEICAIINEKRKANKKVTLGETLIKNLMSEAEDFKKQLGSKKFNNLSNMWKCLNGL